MKIRIGTKDSDIAVTRAEALGAQLTEAGHEVEIIRLPDIGDRENISPLRLGLLRDDFDLAIHRMNRVPGDDTPGLVIAAIPERDDMRDVLCGTGGQDLAGLRDGGRIATGSALRQASVNRLRPGLEFVPLKPDLTTCLDQVRSGELDGVVTSAADIEALDRGDQITEYLPSVPAAGQGALGYECRDSDTELLAVLADFEDADTRICVVGERAVRDNLDLSDQVSLGVRGLRSGVLSLRAAVVPHDGSEGLNVQMGMPTSEFHAQRVGERLAQALRQRGAEQLGREPEPVVEETDAKRVRPTELADARVIVPREEGRLAEGLRECGIDVESVPLQKRDVLTVSSTLDGADWIAFTSTRAVASIHELGWTLPRSAKLAAVGPGTADALTDLGYTVDLVPTDGAGVTALLEVWPDGEGKVLVPGSALLAPSFVASLQTKGYTAQLVPVYTMQVLPEAPEAAREAWNESLYDAVVISSGSNALAVGKLLGWNSEIPVIAVGESAIRVLGRAGVDIAARTDSYLPSDVAALIAEVLQRNGSGN